MRRTCIDITQFRSLGTQTNKIMLLIHNKLKDLVFNFPITSSPKDCLHGEMLEQVRRISFRFGKNKRESKY